MKYNIEGIEKSKTIKSTQIINKKNSGKAIIVNYLDGTQDVFELNNENLNAIKDITETQGKQFVLQESKKLRIEKIVANINLFLFIAMIVLSTLSTLICPLFGISISFSTLESLVALLLGLVSVFSVINIKHKQKYLEKYKLYFEQVKEKLEDYKEILEKEKQLTKQKNNDSVRLNSVLDLDNVSLKQVESINDKVDRYYKVDRQKVKKIENPSLH